MYAHHCDYLVVGGIPPEISEAEFQDAFIKYGKIMDVNLMMDKISARSRGFGFITFVDYESAEKAMMDSKNIQIGGRFVIP